MIKVFVSTFVMLFVSMPAFASDEGSAKFVINDDESILTIYDNAAKAIYQRLDVKTSVRVSENGDEFTRDSIKTGNQYSCFKTEQRTYATDSWGAPSFKCVFTLSETGNGKLSGKIQ
jgi:hypothetical protein